MKKLILLSTLLLSFMAYAEEAQDSDMEDKALIQATESMIKSDEKADVKADTKVDTKADVKEREPAADEDKPLTTKEEAPSSKKEEQIPAFHEAHSKVDKPQSLWGRLVLSLVVVIAVAGGLILAVRRWSKAKNTVGTNAKVKINHQLHLGPKKSIALIEVAGEHLLIGITDNNISLLKTLSIINDEIPEQVPHNFEDVLQEDFAFGKNLDVRIR